MEKTMSGESRTPQQFREHYEIEKELAGRLRNAPREERRHLYSSLYNQMYERVPHHPQLTRKRSPQESAEAVATQMRLLRRFLHKDVTFLELGAGDCALALEVARQVKQVYAVDVSDKITENLTPPKNFQLVLSDGCSIPVPPESVTVAYSNQLMEHLHPEDALEQLQNVYNALAPGGVYVCITPNRLAGPHDISQFFDRVATGFHLKEYTNAELSRLFRESGFSRCRTYVGLKGRFTSLPVFPLRCVEAFLSALPHTLRRALARRLPFRALLGIQLAGTK
jgi:SAM-dependent methyltransferase